MVFSIVYYSDTKCKHTRFHAFSSYEKNKIFKVDWDTLGEATNKQQLSDRRNQVRNVDISS